ncbi:hypothetical protein BwSF21_56340 [Bradyrhizobium ottawaense]|nr:hypothetical protein BwSF21_56340 [Bradyrhizobium ottawaense]
MSQMDSAHCIIVRATVREIESDSDGEDVLERGLAAEVKDASEVVPGQGGKQRAADMRSPLSYGTLEEMLTGIGPKNPRQKIDATSVALQFDGHHSFSWRV